MDKVEPYKILILIRIKAVEDKNTDFLKNGSSYTLRIKDIRLYKDWAQLSRFYLKTEIESSLGMLCFEK
jgi:hypothetical protein